MHSASSSKQANQPSLKRQNDKRNEWSTLQIFIIREKKTRLSENNKLKTWDIVKGILWKLQCS